MNCYESAYRLIDGARSIVLICHINPDGDTIGSALALRGFLLKCGKTVDVVCDSDRADKLNFLIDGENPILSDTNKCYDLAIAVDCGDLDRMGLARKNFLRADKRMVIDHHKTNDKRGDVNVIEADSASTTQIMFKLLSGYKRELIGREEASFLYAGLLTDSGGFYYESTTSETHAVAGALIDILGSFHNYIYYKLFDEVSPEKFNLHQGALSKAKFYDGGKIAMITFTAEDFARTGTDLSHTEGAVSQLQKIAGVMVAVAVTEVARNSYKVSFRSRGNTDVSLSASVFGGGGHKNASGCRLSGYYEDVKDKILKSVRDIL